jgi:hypothetical protein
VGVIIAIARLEADNKILLIVIEKTKIRDFMSRYSNVLSLSRRLIDFHTLLCIWMEKISFIHADFSRVFERFFSKRKNV